MKNNIYRDINITRPANTTTYAANDVIGSSTAAGGGVITIPSTGGDHDFVPPASVQCFPA
jgi:hypothetical protein